MMNATGCPTINDLFKGISVYAFSKIIACGASSRVSGVFLNYNITNLN